jgi:hypothetical protein
VLILETGRLHRGIRQSRYDPEGTEEGGVIDTAPLHEPGVERQISLEGYAYNPKIRSRRQDALLPNPEKLSTCQRPH